MITRGVAGRGLHLNDIGAHVAEHLSCIRTQHHGRDVDNPDAGQRACCCGHVSLPHRGANFADHVLAGNNCGQAGRSMRATGRPSSGCTLIAKS